MKVVLNSYLFRAVCAIVLGILVIMWPEALLQVLVNVFGAMFTIAGAFSIADYFLARNRKRQGVQKMFPFIGLGCLLFGLVLLIWPMLFLDSLMKLLGGVLMFAGIMQTITLVRARSIAPLMWYVFVVPILLVIAGGSIIGMGVQAMTWPLYVVGVAGLIYGVSELIYGIRYQRMYRRLHAEYIDYTEVK